MIGPPLSTSPLVTGWVERHRGALSFALHMVGIPATLLGPMLLPVGLFAWTLAPALLGIGLFVGGYLLQFVGHALEGSDPGELIALKRKLGWATVEVAPAAQSSRRLA